MLCTRHCLQQKLEVVSEFHMDGRPFVMCLVDCRIVIASEPSCCESRATQSSVVTQLN